MGAAVPYRQQPYAWRLLPGKWRKPAEQNVRNDSSSPNVHFEAISMHAQAWKLIYHSDGDTSYNSLMFHL